MKASVKIMGVVGILALTGCGAPLKQEKTTVVETVAPQSNIVTGTLAEARYNNSNQLFTCFYEFPGKNIKPFPQPKRNCAPKIYVNTDTSTVSFGK